MDRHPTGESRAEPGEPGSREVRQSALRSTRHRVVTRLRLARMALRRARYLRDLRSGVGRWARRASAAIDGPGSSDGVRVLVIAHVFYPDLWPELAERIDRIPGDVDLVVTLVAGRSEGLAPAVRRRFPEAEVRVLENRGRDMWPLVQVLDLVPGHDVVLKIHTKQTPHLPKGDQWRTSLLDGVAGSGQLVDRILRLQASDSRIGIVAPPRNVLGREFIGNNQQVLDGLVRRSGVPYDPAQMWFPAGSMFWVRPEILMDLAALDLEEDDFGAETGAIDGTLAHAMERYLGVVAAARGLAVIESSEVAQLIHDGRP